MIAIRLLRARWPERKGSRFQIELVVTPLEWDLLPTPDERCYQYGWRWLCFTLAWGSWIV